MNFQRLPPRDVMLQELRNLEMTTCEAIILQHHQIKPELYKGFKG